MGVSLATESIEDYVENLDGLLLPGGDYDIPPQMTVDEAVELAGLTQKGDAFITNLSGGERIEYRNASPDTLTSFSLHLYLNAFRPGSRWAEVDSVEGRRRFNDLKDPDFAFNHEVAA